MNTIEMDSVVDYDCGSLYHQDLRESVSEYNFLDHSQILIDFIKKNLNIDVAEEDFETYCDYFDNIYLAFYDTIEQDDAIIYLVSAFDVYKKYVYEGEYVRDEKLTKLWRKTMNLTYPKSTYSADLEEKLAKEKSSKVDDIL